MERRTTLVVVVTAVLVLGVLAVLRYTGAGVAGGPITGLGGKCVDVARASPGDGTPIRLYRCNRSVSQSWVFGPDGTLKALGKCMDVVGGSSMSGSRIQIYGCNGSKAQKWRLYQSRWLINVKASRCLTVADPGSQIGNQLQLKTCTPGDSGQNWTVARTFDTTQRLLPRTAGMSTAPPSR